jgi:hypothetical protein
MTTMTTTITTPARSTTAARKSAPAPRLLSIESLAHRPLAAPVRFRIEATGDYLLEVATSAQLMAFGVPGSARSDETHADEFVECHANCYVRLWRE